MSPKIHRKFHFRVDIKIQAIQAWKIQVNCVWSSLFVVVHVFWFFISVFIGLLDTHGHFPSAMYLCMST